MLTLPTKKKWFDMILSGEKTEEYREQTEYYRKRLENLFKRRNGEHKADTGKRKIAFRNGYNATSPTFVAVCTWDIGTGKEEWGAEKGKEYNRIHIKAIVERRNC